MKSREDFILFVCVFGRVVYYSAINESSFNRLLIKGFKDLLNSKEDLLNLSSRFSKSSLNIIYGWFHCIEKRKYVYLCDL